MLTLTGLEKVTATLSASRLTYTQLIISSRSAWKNRENVVTFNSYVVNKQDQMQKIGLYFIDTGKIINGHTPA